VTSQSTTTTSALARSTPSGVLIRARGVMLVVAFVMLALSRFARWACRRGVGNAVMGPFDEIWHPSGGHTHVEAQEQQERLTPAPSPGDRPTAGTPT